MILCTFLLLIASAYSFVAHRSTTDLNIDRPAESMATAIKNVELQLLLPELISVSTKEYFVENKRRKRRHGIASTEDFETLNSATMSTKKRSLPMNDVNVYEKPAFSEQLKTLMQNVNSDVVLVLCKIKNTEQNQIENLQNQETKRSGKQLNLFASENDAVLTSVNIDTETFQLMPLNYKNIMKLPTIFSTPNSEPMRIWAIGSVAKFPPVLEHFLQRIQSYYSIYKYEDLSRPGGFNSGSANQVVRVTKTSTVKTPTTSIQLDTIIHDETITSTKTTDTENATVLNDSVKQTTQISETTTIN